MFLKNVQSSQFTKAILKAYKDAGMWAIPHVDIYKLKDDGSNWDDSVIGWDICDPLQ